MPDQDESPNGNAPVETEYERFKKLTKELVSVPKSAIKANGEPRKPKRPARPAKS